MSTEPGQLHGGQRRLFATRRNGVLSWVGTDHLGGTIRVANADFTPHDQMRYTPFGAHRDAAASLQTDDRFTGQTWDAATGLYFYGARYYDPALGRFVQPDSVVPRPFDPQSLNRYSYTSNNPVGRIDPTGHSDEDFFGPGPVCYLPKRPFEPGPSPRHQEGIDPTPADAPSGAYTNEPAVLPIPGGPMTTIPIDLPQMPVDGGDGMGGWRDEDQRARRPWFRPGHGARSHG